MPGTGDTATFNNGGNGNVVIDLGSGVTINTILFNTSSAAAYTIGSGAVGSQTLTLNDSGAITINSTVTNSQLFNAAITLGTAAAFGYTLTNNSTTALLTLAGDIQGGTGGTAGAKTLTLGGAGNITVNGAVKNGGASSVALTKTGLGTLTLGGISTYTGVTTIQGGTVNLNANTGSGSLAAATGLTFSGGGGTFNYQASSSGSTQTLGALTFSAGGSNVQSTHNGGVSGLTFTSLAARTAGATGNFVITGGANGSTNSIAFTTISAGFQNQGLFFNGADYAYANGANSYVRGISYGNDAGTATTAGGSTLGVTGHVQLTGSVSGQTTTSINTLKFSGAQNLNLASAQTLTITNAGILKAGGGTAQISGGTGLAAGSAEWVLRADSATDVLKIDSVMSGTGGLTVTGGGKVYLNAANTFTGAVSIAGGTLAMNFAYSSDVTNPLGAAGARTFTLSGGGTLQLLGASTYNPASTTTKTFSIGTGGGVFNIGAGATLQLDDASQFSGAGNLTMTSNGNGLFLVGGSGGSYTAFTGNVTINGGSIRVTNVSGLGNTANRSITVNSGGSLDVGIAAFNPGSGTTITLNGDGLNNTGALQSTAANGTTANNIILASNASIGNTSTFTLGLTGVISGGFSLTKVGAGTGALTLSGLNTYTGNTVVNGGVLIADSATNAAPINSASGLVFSGSGTFRYTGLTANTRAMTLNGLVLMGGAGIVDVNNTGTSTTLTLGSITRLVGGGSVDFRATTGTVGATSLTNVATTALVNGIFGAYATVGTGSSLATKDGSNNVIAYTGYTDINTNGSVIADAAASNVRLQTAAGAGNITLGAATTSINTLFQNTATAVTVDTTAGTLRFGTNGGIVSAATGSITIGTAANAGTLTAGGADNTAGEIIVNTAVATPVIINSTIADNGTGAVSLTRTGLTATTLTLNGTNTFTGSLSIHSGTVVIGTGGLANINTASAVGKGSIAGSAADLVLNGGTLQYTTSTAAQSTDRLFSVGLGNGTIDASGGTGGTLSFTGTGAIGFNGQAGSRTLTLTGTNTGANILASVLGDNGGVTHLSKSGAGTWVLTGNSTYSGTTVVSGGTLQVGNGGTSGSIGTGYVVTTGGTIAFNRSDDVTVGNLFAGTGSISQNAASTLSLSNAANAAGGLRFAAADGGVIDLLSGDILLTGGTTVLASTTGTINGSAGGKILLGAAAGDFGAANGKTLTINAVIANGTQSSLDFFGATSGTGIVVLTADNTFSGTMNIQSGVISVSKIGDSGVAGNLGTNGTINIGTTTATGVTLRYTGTGETSNRVINLAASTGAAILDQSGTGLWKFTGTNTATGAGAKILTLTGSTTGAGEISGVIVDNSANVNTTGVTKAGAGTWTLSGVNTYTGITTVSNGALILGNLLAVQNSVVTNSAIANTATTGIVFKSGLGGTFSIGGLGGSQNLALVDDTGAALTSLTVGGATLTVGGTYSGVLSGSAAITKTGPSIQTFTGANTFTGKLTITGGVLAGNSELAFGAVPGVANADQITLDGGAIGAGTNAVFTIDDANRGITLAAGGGGFYAAAGGVLTVDLSVSGGSNTLTKSGSGTVILTQANTYGATSITGGTLMLSGMGSLGTGAVTLNGGSLVVSGTSVITVGTAATGSSLIYAHTSGAGADLSSGLIMTNGGTLFVDVVNSAATVTFANAIGSATTAGLAKVGAGTLILSPATSGNTYTGTTTAGAGTLRLSFGDGTTVPASNIISASSALNLQGGTLNLNGMTAGTATANAQTFNGTTLATGGSTISATLGTATSVTANLGVIGSRTAGATVQFAMPNTTTTLANVSTTATNSAGILGGWATYGTAAGVATDWAAKDGSNNIIAYAGYTTLTATGGGTSTTTNFTASLASVITLSAGITANTLRVTAGGNTLALGALNMALGGATGGISTTSGTGGILYSATTGTGTISGTTTNTGTGFISVPATTGDLPIYVSTGGTLSIGAGIGGTITAFGITKSGGGTLTLTNGGTGTTANNFTGAVTINGGTISIDGANRLGGSTSLVLNGGTLNQTVNFSNTQAITLGLNGGTLNYNSTAGSGGWTSTSAIAFLGSGSRTLTLGGTATGRVVTLSAALGDGGGPTSLIINGGSATSIFQLSAANSTYSGATTITQGILRLNAANALSSSSNVVFNGGTSNRAILEGTSSFTSFTNALSTLPGQVQWLGNGGFSMASSGQTLTVNLGGNSAPSTVIWGAGSFVPTGSQLQFGQASANSFSSSGIVDFQNPIDLNAASRTVDVSDGNSLIEAILSGAIFSSGAGGVLVKSGLGNLRLAADSSASTNTALSITASSGLIILGSASAIPGSTGATVTVNANSGIVLTGSMNPLATIGSRIVTTSAGSIALDTNSSETLDFSGFSALSLGAFSNTVGQPVLFTGSIITNNNTYRLAPSRSANTQTLNTAITGNGLINLAGDRAVSILMLPNASQLTNNGVTARSLVVGNGVTYLGSYNTYTGGTSVSALAASDGIVGIGHDASLGSGTVAFTSATSFIGALNGDRALSNNVTTIGGNWVAAGNLASDSITNAGSMTYLGTVTLGNNTNIFARTRSAIFLGDVAAAGTITISSGSVSMIGSKTHARPTTIAVGGTLVIDSNASLGSGTGTLTIGGGTAAATPTTLRIQPGVTGTITLTGRAVTIGTNFAPVFEISAGAILAIQGNLTGTTTEVFSKTGLGTLTLGGTANTVSSTNANGLQIFGGTVLIDGTASASARFNNLTTNQLSLGTGTNGTFSNGGTFAMTSGTNTIAQTFTNLASAAKANALSFTTGTGGQTNLTFNGATVNRSALGGTLAITTAGSGTSTITLSGTVTSGATTANQIWLDAGTSGNPFAYINGTDWAARNGSNQIVSLGSAGAGSYTLSTATTLAGNADMDSTVPTTTLAGNTTLTSLRFNAATAHTLDLGTNTLVAGGILIGTGTGTNNETITGATGTLQGVASRDLVLINANTAGDGTTTGLLIIDAVIANNTGATALTKSGPGTVVLGGANTFTGSIYLNQGVLSVATAGTATAGNPLGQMVSGTTNLIFNGGTLRYTGTGTSTTDRGATINTFSTIDVSSSTGVLVMTQGISGIAARAGLLTKSGDGALSLSGATDNANLSMVVSGGTLNLDKSVGGIRALSGGAGATALIVNTGGTARITGAGGDQIFNGSSVVVNGTGQFDLNGFSETIDTLAGAGIVTNTGSNGSAITLTLGDATVVGAQTNIGPQTLAAAAAGVASTGLASFFGTISDNGTNIISLTKAGSGTQTFSYSGGSSTYTYSGDTTIISGTLLLRAANLLPSGSGKGNVSLVGNTMIFGVTVPGTLDMGGFDQAINGLTGTAGSIVTNTPLSTVSANQTNILTVGNNDQTSTFAGILQDGYVVKPGSTPVGYFGFVALTKTGAGVLTLSGTNTNTGIVTINEGRIDLNNSAGNALATNVAINTTGTLKLLSNNQLLDSKTVTISGGTFDINGRTETVGVALIDGGISDTAGGGVLSSLSSFDLRKGTVSAVLGGTSGLAKTTADTVTLSAVNTYTGATSLSGSGSLIIGSTGAIDNSSGITLGGTSRLFVNGSTATSVGISVGAGTTLGGTGTVNGTVAVSAAGIIQAGQFNAGSLTIGTVGFSGAATVNLFNIDAGGSASLLNVLNSLSTTAGGGNVVTINVTNSGSLANGTYKLIDVGTLTWGGGNNNFAIGAISGLGGRQASTLNFIDNDALYVTISGANPVWSGALGSEWSANILDAPKNWYVGTISNTTDYIDLPNPDTVLFDDTATGTTTVDISVADVNPNGVTFNNSSLDYTLTGSKSILGGTSLVKSGTGMLTLSNANAFTGGLVINGGVVRLNNAAAIGAANALSFGASAAAGTKLQLNGFNTTITGLSTNATPGSPVVENGHASTASVLTVNLAAGSNTFAGVLQDGSASTLGLTKQGAGTLILSGANTLTGGNTLTAGTLQIGAGGTSGSLRGATSIAAGASLIFNRSDSRTHSGGITGAGAVGITGGGTLVLTGNAAHTGGTTIASDNTLQIGNGGVIGALSGTGNIANSGSLVFYRSGSSTIQADINGTGSLIVGNGGIAGTLILTGSNIYSGATTINNNAVLQVGNGGTSGTLGTGTITDDGQLAFDRSDAVTVGAVINGTGSFRVMDGLVTLSAANGYTGGTLIDSGAALTVGNGSTGAIQGMDGAGAGNVVNNGDLTFNRTGTHTWDNQIGGAGNVQTSAGNWIFTSTNSHTGTTTINTGTTLTVGNGGTTGTISSGAVINNGGLTFNRSNTYTLAAGNLVTGSGAVTLLQGSITAAVDNQFNTTGALNFLTAVPTGITTTVALDLSAGGGSSFGTLNVRTNSATANVITLGNDKTLSLTGLSMGVDVAATTGATQTKLNVTGNGNLSIVGATVQIGAVQTNTDANNNSNGILDLSGLTGTSGFNANVTTFNVGAGKSTAGSLILTNVANTIAATTLTIGDSTGNNGAGILSTLTLGTGTNSLLADTINIGRSKGSAPGLITFASQAAGSAGTVTIANKAGTGAANINIGDLNGTNTAGGAVGTLDLRGHIATVNAGIVTVSNNNNPGTGSTTGTIHFDAGTFNVNTLNVGIKTAAGTGASTGTVNIGGGAFTVNTALTLGSQASAGSSVAALNITGGTFTSNANVVQGGGTTSSSITLNGVSAFMNMTNKTIGSGTNQITFNAQAGTLRNLGELNGGGTLNKTTAGVLILDTANAYTGLTTVTAGVLQIKHGSALGGVTNGTSVTSGAALEVSNDITTLAEGLALNGTGISSGGALRNTGGSNDFTGLVTLASASRINSDAGLLTLSGGIAGTNVNLTVGGAGDTTISNAITLGTGGIVKDGAGTLTLSGTNTYAGKTTINSGVLSVSSEENLGNNPASSTADQLTLNGGTLRATESFSINDANRGVTLGASGGTVEVTSSKTLTIANVVAGSGGSLTKAGAGTLVLSAANTYTGTTTVAGGTLQVGDGASGSLAGAGNVTVTNTGTKLSGSGSIASSTIIGNGAILAPGVGDTDASNQTLTFTAAGTAVQVQDGGYIQLGLTSSTQIDVGFDWTQENALSYLNDLTTNGANLNETTYSDHWKNAGSTYDSLKLTNGTFDLGSTAGGTVRVFGNSPSYTIGNIFKVLDWSTVGVADSLLAGSGSFTLADLDLSGVSLGAGLGWDTSAFTTYGVIVVVPEPSRALLLLLGLLGLLRRRRRVIP